MVSEHNRTAAEKPFQYKSSLSVNLARDSKDEADTVPSKTTGEAFKHLLVGEGQEGSGELLARLEKAISLGDHKVAAVLAKELAKLKISSRLTEQESDEKTPQKLSPPVKLVKYDLYQDSRL